jgi:hypothetical protein
MLKQPKLSKCKNCRNPFQKTSSFACCCMACALDYLDKQKEKKFKRETTAMKKNHYQKDLKWQHKQCQPVFNKLRRLQELKWFKDRGLEPVCISCSKPLGGDEWANGHYKSVGSSSYLRYDLKNSYLQHNRRCNKALSADIAGTSTTHGYKTGLVIRFGEQEGNEIMDYCERFSSVVHRFEWQDLERMRKEWNKEIRELEKYLNV